MADPLPMEHEFSRRLGSFLAGNKWWYLVQAVREELGDEAIVPFVQLENGEMKDVDEEFNKNWFKWTVGRRDIDGPLGSIDYAALSTWTYLTGSDIKTVEGHVTVISSMDIDADEAKRRAVEFATNVLKAEKNVQCNATQAENLSAEGAQVGTKWEVTGTATTDG